jgi:hypothetical protein
MTQPTASVIDERPLATKIEALAGFGLGAADIARVIHMDQAVLEQDYAHELAAGQIKANARVAESLYRKATGEGREAVIAAIFWLKTRARWSEASDRDRAAAAGSISLSVTYEAPPQDSG